MPADYECPVSGDSGTQGLLPQQIMGAPSRGIRALKDCRHSRLWVIRFGGLGRSRIIVATDKDLFNTEVSN